MEDDFFSKLAELHAATLETPADASVFLQGGFANLSKLLETQSISAPMQKFVWNVQNEERINQARGMALPATRRSKRTVSGAVC